MHTPDDRAESIKTWNEVWGINIDTIDKVMDVCDMTYNDSTFDWVIDKSTLDALMCGDES